jgi:Lactonase, 7-bladed beta-propeller
MSLRENDTTPDLGGIVGFALTEAGGLGELVGTWSSGGKHPRDFNLVEVPGFKEVFVVANLNSNNVVVFDRDSGTGAVGKQLASAEVNSPVSVLAIGDVDDLSMEAVAPGSAASPPAALPGLDDDGVSGVAPTGVGDADDAGESMGGAAIATSEREPGACGEDETVGASGECDATSISADVAVPTAVTCMFVVAVSVATSLIGVW